MDFEELSFKLKPLFEDEFASRISKDPSLVTHAVASLSDLAVRLREPRNRDILRESGILQQLLNLLSQVLDGSYSSSSVMQVGGEIVRCLANCLADNDHNRTFFMSHIFTPTATLREQFRSIFKFKDQEGAQVDVDVKFYLTALVKNLCLGNEEYTRKCSSEFTGVLFEVLEHKHENSERGIELVIMTADLLSDFVESSHQSVAVGQLAQLAKLLNETAPKAGFVVNPNEEEEDEDEDAYGELVQLLSDIIEKVVSRNEVLDFSNESVTHQLQARLLEALSTLEVKESLENKLIILRRLVSIIGHVSASRSNSNLQDRQLCYKVLTTDYKSYAVAAALIVLSNSVSSRDAANDVSRQITLSSLIRRCQAFQDPMQFQGLLDLLKKLINLSNAHELTDADLSLLYLELKTCHDQCQYFQSLSPLLDSLLIKLAAVLPGTVLRGALDQNENFKTVICERGGTAACLLVDKLAVQKRQEDEDILSKLWNSIFQFKDTSTTNPGELSSSFFFQLMKTLGIYLRSRDVNLPNSLFVSHCNQISQLLHAVEPLKGKQDSASLSIHNNARFVAGMTINILKDKVLTTEEIQLRDSATKLLVPES
ncbi:LADA_0C06634g1_1 [Lachancea dasiensis]|uniref:LADA_0C06634g1_1 n=1 Tax=Lachancea dasiensis TaxID=1072105 RepID=A0A1G4IZ89_9SACH|nr:LADA_0C06634g1_1 [Lachancea dasiensis]